MTATKFDTMGKEELRAACRAAGVSYSKLNNDGMRAALRAAAVIAAEAAQDEREIEAYNNGEPSGESEMTDEDGAYYSAPIAANPFAALTGGVVAPVAATGVKFVDGKKYEEPTDQSAKVIRPRAAKTPAPLVAPVVRKGYKIDPTRPVQNGVKRPSVGTVCEAVWSVFDGMHASETGLCAADLPVIADAHAWNRTNVACEYYTWRKFMGIKKTNAA